MIAEPFSGITCALLQVLHGPQTGIRALLACYLGLCLALLLGLGLTVGLSAAGTWAVLVGVRLASLLWVQPARPPARHPRGMAALELAAPDPRPAPQLVPQREGGGWRRSMPNTARISATALRAQR